MEMNLKAAAVAGGLTGTAISAVCAALVVAFPIGFGRSYATSVFHGMDVSSLIVRPEFTAFSLLLGFVYAFLTGFAIGGGFAFAYNMAEKKLGR